MQLLYRCDIISIGHICTCHVCKVGALVVAMATVILVIRKCTIKVEPVMDYSDVQNILVS